MKTGWLGGQDEALKSAFLMSGALVLVGVWVGTFSRVSTRRKA